MSDELLKNDFFPIPARKLVTTRKTPEIEAPEIIDMGHVGEAEKIDISVIDMFIKEDFTLVIASVSVDTNG